MAPRPVPPTPTDDPQVIVDYLKTLGDSQASTWLRANIDKIPDRSLTLVEEQIRLSSAMSATTADGEDWERTLIAFEDVFDARATEATRRDTEAAQRDALEAGGLTPDQVQRSIDQAAEEAEPDFTPTPAPILALTAGLAPSTAEQAAMVAAWNEFYPDQPVTNYKELKGRVGGSRARDPMVLQVLDYAFTGEEPITVYEWTMPGAVLPNGTRQQATVRVTDAEFAAMKDQYGKDFNSKDVLKFAQIAASVGLTEASSDARNGSPIPAWQIMAAIAANRGLYDVGVDVTPDKGLEPRAGVAGAGTGFGGGVAAAAAQELAKQRQKAKLTASEIAQLRNDALTFKQGLNTYGQNDLLAFVSIFSSPLALKLSTTPIDKLDPIDRKRMSSIMLNSGFSPEHLASMGYAALGEADLDVNRPDSNGGSSGSVRTMPDPEAIRQRAKDMYKALFASDPSESELSALVGAVSGAISGAADNQNIDAEAQIRKRLESDPQYADLYGKTPSGMGEQEYQAQFRAGAASIIGERAPDPNVVRSGLRTGQYQTAVGAAAVGAGTDNSTWMGRLAQAASLVNANT
jgi:hypothetical protein